MPREIAEAGAEHPAGERADEEAGPLRSARSISGLRAPLQDSACEDPPGTGAEVQPCREGPVNPRRWLGIAAHRCRVCDPASRAVPRSLAEPPRSAIPLD